jgi:alanine racemase
LLRPTWADVDLGAIRANVAVLADRVAPASVMAVVKADGYGHGAASVGRAAIEGGAGALAVALVEEGLALRDAGIDVPVLVLAEAEPSALDAAIAARLDLTVASLHAVDAIGDARDGRAVRVHVKVDTGMHRMGCDPAAIVSIARRVVERGVELHGVWSHLANADDPKSEVTAAQLARFEAALDELRATGCTWTSTHLANSAGAIAHPATRFDLVRCGIAIYGVEPARDLAGAVDLRPAMSLHSRISALRTVAAGEAVSYGGHWTATRSTAIATVPIGYADGVPRALGLTGGEVLVRGARRPIRGVVTMDQLMIEVVDDCAIGDEVVLLGEQGNETITAWDWADRVGQIAYEVLTGIGARVARRYGT